MKPVEKIFRFSTCSALYDGPSEPAEPQTCSEQIQESKPVRTPVCPSICIYRVKSELFYCKSEAEINPLLNSDGSAAGSSRSGSCLYLRASELVSWCSPAVPD